MNALPVDETVGSPVAEPSTGLGAAGLAGGLLAELAAERAGSGDLHELLRGFLHGLVELAGASAGAVRVFDDEMQRMRLVGHVGLPDSVTDGEQWVQADCGVCGAAARQQAPRWSGDEAGCALRGVPQLMGGGCRHVLAVPLQHGGRRLGLVSLFFDGPERPARDLPAVLKPVGDLLGLALEKARVERHNARLQLQQERRGMAADVHDSLAQSLAFVKMRLPLLEDALREHDEARSLRYCEDIRRTVTGAHVQLRQILADLRTPADPLGARHALHDLAQAFVQHSGIALDLALPDGDWPLAPAQQVQLRLIVQEALANVARHAQARHAALRVNLDDAHLDLRVEDDGTGLGDAARTPPGLGGPHYGLDIMRSRAERIGATLTIAPRAGGGTCVHLRLALPPHDGGCA